MVAFPAALDTFVNPGATDAMNGAISHSAQHADANDAIEALEGKVGVDGSAVATTLDYKVAQLQAAVAALLARQFPIGHVLISATDTDPATYLGYGTWAKFGAGRTLVGLDAGDADFDTALETGGAKAVAAVGTNANEAGHTHQVTSNVAVADHTYTPAGTNAAATIAWPAGVPTATGCAVADHAAHTHSVTSNVAVANHVFTQPTIAWPAGVPTAANESAHTHSVTSNVAVADHASHTHTVTAAGTNSAPAFTGSASTSSATGAAPKLVTSNTSTGVAVITTPVGTVAAPVFTGSQVTSGGPSATLSHTVTNNAVTSGAGSAHTHTISWPAGVPTASGGAVDAHAVTNNAVTSGNPSATLSHSVTQPTIAWPAGVPTATAAAFTGTQATISHTVTNNQVTSGAGSSHTHTFTGSATSVVQPYVVVYFWRRSA